MLRLVVIGCLSIGVAMASRPVDPLQAPVLWSGYADAVRSTPAATVATDTLPIALSSGQVIQLAGAIAPGHIAATVLHPDDGISRAHSVFADLGQFAPTAQLARTSTQFVASIRGSQVSQVAGFDASGEARWVRPWLAKVVAAPPDAFWLLWGGRFEKVDLDGRTLVTALADLPRSDAAEISLLASNDSALFAVHQIGYSGAPDVRVLFEARSKDNGTLLWRQEVLADAPAIGCATADGAHLYLVGDGGSPAPPGAGSRILEVRSVTDGSLLRRLVFPLSNSASGCTVLSDGNGGVGILFNRSLSSTIARVDTEGLAWARDTTLGLSTLTRVAWTGDSLLVVGNRAGSPVLRVERFAGSSGASMGQLEIFGGVIDGNVDLVRRTGEWVIARPYPGGVERLRVGDDLALRSTVVASAMSVTALPAAHALDGDRIHEVTEQDFGNESGLRVRTRDALSGQVLRERTLPGILFAPEWQVRGTSLSARGDDLLLRVSALPASASGTCSQLPRQVLVMLDSGTLAVRWHDSFRADVAHRAELGADGVVVLAGPTVNLATCTTGEPFSVRGRSTIGGQTLWSRTFPGSSSLLGVHADAVVVLAAGPWPGTVETLASTTGETDWTAPAAMSSSPLSTFAVLPQRLHLFDLADGRRALAATAYARNTGLTEFRSEVWLGGEYAWTSAAAVAGQRLLLTGARSEFNFVATRQAPVFALIDADTGNVRAQRLFPRVGQADWLIRPAGQHAQGADPRLLVSNFNHNSTSSFRTVGLMRVNTDTGDVGGEHVLWRTLPRGFAARIGWSSIDNVDVLQDGAVLIGGARIDPQHGRRRALARLAMPSDSAGNLSLTTSNVPSSTVGDDVVVRVVVDNASDAVAPGLTLLATDSAPVADILACVIEGTGVCPSSATFDAAVLSLGPRSRASFDVRLGSGRHPAFSSERRVDVGLATASPWRMADLVRGDTVGAASFRLGPYANGFE